MSRWLAAATSAMAMCCGLPMPLVVGHPRLRLGRGDDVGCGPVGQGGGGDLRPFEIWHQRDRREILDRVPGYLGLQATSHQA